MNRGGAETMVMNLYRAIDREQIQFDFVSFSEEKGDYDGEILSLGGRIHTISESNPIKRMNSLTKLLKSHPEYQTVHCHTLLSNAFHLIAAKRAGVSMRISHSHSTDDSSKSKLIKKIYTYWAIESISKNSTHFIACAEDAAKYLFPKERNVMILPNSVDVNYFASKGEKEKRYLRDTYKIPNNTIVLSQIGSLNLNKNQLFSLQIIEQLKKKNIPVKFFIIGDGELKKVLEETIRNLDLTDEVELLGKRSDIGEIIAGSDVVLMPSKYEGFPVVLVEVQATGTPVIVSKFVSDEVDLGVNLVHFCDLDVTEWINKILSTTKVARIPNNQRIEVLENKNFDIHKSARIIENYYNQFN